MTNKEKIVMDYEKKRRLIALRDSMKKYGYADGVEELESIFPDLAESEDEKIRKWCISHFKECFHTSKDNLEYRQYLNNKIIPWFEKQKENPQSKSAIESWKDMRLEVYQQASGNRHEPNYSDDTTKMFSLTDIDEIFEKIAEKQKGQEPINESNMQEPTVDEARIWNEAYEKGYSLGYENGRNEQKPAEWSVEDEDRIRQIERIAQEAGCTQKLQEEIHDWLKSLRPQPKQEQQIKVGDKVSIHCRKDRNEDVISIYDGEVGKVIHVWDAKKNPWGHIGVSLDNGCNNGFYEDELEVLDESHWKPSEEQMEALKKTTRLANFGSDAKRMDALLSLYEQLKKL